uniref:Dynein axonemal intermediate chain 7 n=1 Tax=Tetraodon nigroviridis TaxID=99883 RepID=H3CN91_TETNG
AAPKGQKASKSKKGKSKKEEEEKRRQREEEEARVSDTYQHIPKIKPQPLNSSRIHLMQDSERREGELDELRHLLEKNHTAVIKWKSDAVERETWERYMRCDGTPDPRSQREINTYITLWRDDPEVNITCVLQQCSSAQQLIEDLEVLLKDAPHSEEEETYRETITGLLELIQSKQLLATEELLKNANESIDSETGNMQTVVKDRHVTVCLWANFRKNPRFKGFHFEEAGLGFELPKQLAVSDVAVRLMHTHYDLLSLLARLAHPGTSTSPRKLGEHSAALVCALVFSSCSPEGDTEEVPAADVDITETAQESEVIKVLKYQRIKKTHTNCVSEEEEDGLGKGGLDSSVMTQMEVLEAEGELTSPVPVPETVTTYRVHFRKAVVDLMQYTPVGGVLYYDAFYLPPQAHRANGWKIRQVLDQGLRLFPYPSKTSETGSEEQSMSPPVGVSFTLPDNVIFLKPPRAARWDDAGKQWRLDGVTDVSYKKEEGKICIKMTSFQPLVLLQETYANFPFQSWELWPLGQDAALFTINGALISLSIKIQGSLCMLQLEQERALPQLTDRWMSVAALQAAMIGAGLNVFVNEHSEKYASACAKDPLTEHAAYEQMALLASAVAFSWSRWNAICGSEHLVVRACEHRGPGSAPGPEQPWSLYLLDAQRSKKLALTEEGEAFSPDHAPGSEFHSTFVHILRDGLSAEGLARVGGSHYLFVSAVQSLLCGTRPLTYT